VADIRAIDGGKGKPVQAVVEVLRDLLAEAEAGRIHQVLVIDQGGDSYRISGALNDPWGMAGACTLQAVPFLQQIIEEDCEQ
jgi:hypothetical protein